MSSPSLTAAVEPAPRAHAGPPLVDDRPGRPLPVLRHGVLVGDEPFFYALETQTLSLHPAFLPRRAPRPPSKLRADHGPRTGAPVVRRQHLPGPLGATSGSTRATPTYYEPLYGDQRAGPSVIDHCRPATARQPVRARSAWPRRQRRTTSSPCSRANVYAGGSAGRSTRCARDIGYGTFSTIEHTWVMRYHRRVRRPRSTSSRPCPRSLATVTSPVPALLALHDTVPPMPGHPDWTSGTGHRHGGARVRGPHRRPAAGGRAAGQALTAIGGTPPGDHAGRCRRYPAARWSAPSRSRRCCIALAPFQWSAKPLPQPMKKPAQGGRLLAPGLPRSGYRRSAAADR